MSEMNIIEMYIMSDSYTYDTDITYISDICYPYISEMYVMSVSYLSEMCIISESYIYTIRI